MVGRVGVRDLQGPLVGAAYAVIVVKAARRRLFVETIVADVYEDEENSRKSWVEVIVEC